MKTKTENSPVAVVIDRLNPAGFFSDFHWVLAALATLDERISWPVVSQRQATILGLDASFHWKWDWLDFFELNQQESAFVSEFEIQVLDPSTHPDSGDGSSFAALRKAFLKHSGIRQELTSAFDEALRDIDLSSFLGVHFRSGDMRWAPLHPTPPSSKIMLETVKRQLSARDLESVFFASNSESFLRRVKKQFPQHCVSALDLHNRVRELLPSGISQTAAIVLFDAYCLSKTKAIVHSPSNVAVAAKILSSQQLEGGTEIRLGTNAKRLPTAILLGTFLWPFLETQRRRKLTYVETKRSDWFAK